MNCGCGRSPTGKCLGWHKLSEQEFQRKLSIYNAKKTDKGVSNEGKVYAKY